MNDLLAHGGIDRWNKFKKVTATYVGGGRVADERSRGVSPSH
jgi:hypothetical protein